jgi:DNA gyrase subunit A
MENIKSLILSNTSIENIEKQINIGNKILELENQSFVLLINKDYIFKIISLNEYKEIIENIVLNKKTKNIFIDNLISIDLTTRNSRIIFFTQSGKYFSTSINKLLKIKNLEDYFDIDIQDEIIDVISIGENLKNIENLKILFATNSGLVKRTKINFFYNECLKSDTAIKLYENDFLKKVIIADDNSQIILGTKAGQLLRFHVNEIKVISKKTFGNIGANLLGLDKNNLIGMDVINYPQAFVLIITENAYGKRTLLVNEDNENIYRFTNKGGKGVKTATITEITGFILYTKIVYDKDILLVITNLKNIFILDVENLSIKGRVDIPDNVYKLNEGEIIDTIIKLPFLN